MFDPHQMPVEPLPGYVAMPAPPLREGDGPINQYVVAHIRTNPIVAAICGEDFYGFVWWKDGVWWAEIQEDHRVVGMHVHTEIEPLMHYVFMYYRRPLACTRPKS